MRLCIQCCRFAIPESGMPAFKTYCKYKLQSSSLGKVFRTFYSGFIKYYFVPMQTYLIFHVESTKTRTGGGGGTLRLEKAMGRSYGGNCLS